MPLIAFVFATANGSLAVIDFWCSLTGTCHHPALITGVYAIDGAIGLALAVVLWWHYGNEWRFP